MRYSNALDRRDVGCSEATRLIQKIHYAYHCREIDDKINDDGRQRIVTHERKCAEPHLHDHKKAGEHRGHTCLVAT